MLLVERVSGMFANSHKHNLQLVAFFSRVKYLEGNIMTSHNGCSVGTFRNSKQQYSVQTIISELPVPFCDRELTRWPDHIEREFLATSLRPQDRGENRFYGAWTMLLTYCFDNHFTIAPQCPPKEDSRMTMDFTVARYNYKPNVGIQGPTPVFFVEAKDYRQFTASKRENADTQMRSRIRQMLEEGPGYLAVIRGFSACGPYVREYVGGHGRDGCRILPPHQPRNPASIRFDYLQAEWSIDILSDEGIALIKTMVRRVDDAVKSW